MGNKQIRIGQLIAPFGPGSLYTDRRGIPHVICGLDFWYKRAHVTQGLVLCEEPSEFIKHEPRLIELLRVAGLRAPPDYRAVRRGEEPPPNAALKIPALRFPRWYRQTKTGEMRRFNLHTAKIDRPVGGGSWKPVRFVSACEGGHLCEFPWKEWIGCSCSHDAGLKLTDRGGSELSSIRIECTECPPESSGRNGKTLAGTTLKPNRELGERSRFDEVGIACPGDRPWLGEGASDQGCTHPLVGALINQTNLYFPRTISAILLPDVSVLDEAAEYIRRMLENDPASLGVAKTIWSMGHKPEAVAYVSQALRRQEVESEPGDVEAALEGVFSAAQYSAPDVAVPSELESGLTSFRRAEFNVIRNEIDDAANVPNLRVLKSLVPRSLDAYLDRISLVERLRETRVFYGFDRLEQGTTSLDDMPDSAMGQLFRKPPALSDRWLPAVEVFGEGIYLELQEEKIVSWRRANDGWLTQRINDGFIARLAGVFQTLPPLSGGSREWAMKYLLVHTLAHILINQLVFECGYSSAALRERVYISVDPAAPMAGVLIYTAAGDSDGTLGGLVRLGRPELFEPVMRRAISRASWCSADPVCSERLGGQGSRLANLAACHACVLLPETSCETVNQGLDRAMIVGTPYDRDRGFLSGLV